jgi:hypothetical protein
VSTRSAYSNRSGKRRGRCGAATEELHTTPLLDTEFHYVVAVLATEDATDLRAFAADGEPLFYHFVNPMN